MNSGKDEPAEGATASAAVARLERQYGSLDFLHANPAEVVGSLAEFIHSIGGVLTPEDALALLADESIPCVSAEFLTVFANEDIDEDENAEIIGSGIAELLMNAPPLPQTPVFNHAIALVLSTLAEAVHLAATAGRDEDRDFFLLVIRNLSLTLAEQHPVAEPDSYAGRWNAFDNTVPHTFVVLTAFDVTQLRAAFNRYFALLLDETIEKPHDDDDEPDYTPEEAVLAYSAFLEEILQPGGGEDDFDTIELTDKDFDALLNGTIEGIAPTEPSPENRHMENSAAISNLSVSDSPELLGVIPEDLDEVAVVSIQIEGNAAVETAWYLMTQAQTVAHSGAISEAMIQDNPAHPTVLLHMWADSPDPDVDTGPDGPNHPPCLIIPICLSCHSDICEFVEETGWLVVTPEDEATGVAISLPQEQFMRMELQAFRTALEAL